MDRTCDLVAKPRRNRIANLTPLGAERSLEYVVVRKCLKSRCFTNGQASNLRWIIVNEVVPVFR